MFSFYVQSKKEKIVLQFLQRIEDATAQALWYCSTIWLRHDFPFLLPMIFCYLLKDSPGDQNQLGSDLRKDIYSIHPSNEVKQLIKLY